VLQTSSSEFTVLRVIGVTVLIAGAALALGVSEAVAAFFVGMGFSSTDYVHELERLLEPIRDTFAAVFFFWIGLITDPTLFAGVAGFILIFVVVSTPTKLVSGFLGGRVYGLDARRSTRVAVALTTRGEFSLIIAAIALAGGGVSLAPSLAETIYASTVGYVLVMSILGSLLMQYSEPLETFVTARFGTK
jgi:CPA2 family monovalent cation:H+ antiporter-2